MSANTVSATLLFSLQTLQSKAQQFGLCSYGVRSVNPVILGLSDGKPKNRLCLRFGVAAGEGNRSSVRCRSSTGTGGSGSGDNASKSVLDAFFLGKALAEVLNERIESAVGEFLNIVGRLQAEQQKQVQEFREEVLDRAKQAKLQAARESMGAQGLVAESTTVDITSAAEATSASITVTVTPGSSPSTPSYATEADPDAAAEDRVLEVFNDN